MVFEAKSVLGTPYYLIHYDELHNNIKSLQRAMSTYWSNGIIGYSFKTNRLPWLLNCFKEYGLYAEVVSEDEYFVAKEIGYDRQKIIYNGPFKSKKTFLEALRNRCIVNIDSKRELDWLKEYNDSDMEAVEVGIRVNFDLESRCPGESAMGKEGGRFGFCYENGELQKAIEYIDTLKNVNLTGIHIHNSTKTRSLNIYRVLSEMVCQIKREYGLILKYIDIGGGFYGGLPDKPSFFEYMKVISEELGKEFVKEDTVLIVEPGTSLVSSPFSFVACVIDVKHTVSNHFVTIDGSRIDIDPLMHKTGYFFKIQKKDNAKRKILDKQVICGFTCMENDRLFVLENVEQLLIGDRITFEKAGAYTMALTPSFIRHTPRVYVQKDNQLFPVSGND